MKNRILQLPQNRSFFLFGARGTGKSTLISKEFKNVEHLLIDLLDINEERKYFQDPQKLEQQVLALPQKVKHIIIDEVQKIPALLDVVHSLIEKTDKVFVLTGSSARKLKYGNANLLAGRAVVRNLYPFTVGELGSEFDLKEVLAYGCLPKIQSLKTAEEKSDFLRAYSHIYLKEEIWAEHLIRKLEPFHYFLEVAAQSNGDVVNSANLARDVKVDDKSINQYFSILQDTLIGFYLPAYNGSFRKKLTQKPKFYFFDTGVTRALSRALSIEVQEGTYEFGKLFEQFIVLECYKLVSYFFPDYQLSYLRSHDGLEVDLVVDRPGKPTLFIEIKSASDVQESHLKHLRVIQGLYDDKVECICLSQVDQALMKDGIMVYPWKDGLELLQK